MDLGDGSSGWWSRMLTSSSNFKHSTPSQIGPREFTESLETKKKKSYTVSSIGRVELGLGDVSKTCTTWHIGLRSSQDQALQSGGGLVITHPIPALLAQGLPQQERGLVILAQEGCSTRPLISSLRSG